MTKKKVEKKETNYPPIGPGRKKEGRKSIIMEAVFFFRLHILVSEKYRVVGDGGSA